MDSTEPSQPTQQTTYSQSENPTDQTSSEQDASRRQEQETGPEVDRRTSHDVPSTHDSKPTPTALGQGDTGPLKTREVAADATASKSELEGEQMRAPGEGDVAAAQDTKQGFGEQEDLAADLDAKKAEQDRLRDLRGGDDEGEWQRSADVDVEAAVGGRGVPVIMVAEE